MYSAEIFDLQKFSVHDGPGIRTILFFKGCPLCCKWCANPESQDIKPELFFYPQKCIGCGNCIHKCKTGAIYLSNNIMEFDRDKCIGCGACVEVCYAKSRVLSGEKWTTERAIKELDKDMVFYRKSDGGVTFSGGEAMMFPEFIRDVAKYYHDQEISTAIETCGAIPYNNFETVLPFIDLVLFDIKLINSNKHREYTGFTNDIILENLGKVSRQVNTIVRIPIIPGINDGEEDIAEFGIFLSGLSDRIKEINILPYHDLGKSKYEALGREYLLPIIKAPKDEHLSQIQHQLERLGFIVKIGG